MGVMTDATGRLLVNAVGGADTSGLVKDTTVQSTNTILGQIKTVLEGVSAPEADDVSYDNSTSGLTADNVQSAIDEVVSEKQDSIQGGAVRGPDFNSFNDTMNYWIDLNNSVNGPVSSGFGFLEVIRSSATTKMERFTKFASSGSGMAQTFVRYFVNNQWYSWIQIY